MAKISSIEEDMLMSTRVIEAQDQSIKYIKDIKDVYAYLDPIGSEPDDLKTDKGRDKIIKDFDLICDIISPIDYNPTNSDFLILYPSDKAGVYSKTYGLHKNMKFLKVYKALVETDAIKKFTNIKKYGQEAEKLTKNTFFVTFEPKFTIGNKAVDKYNELERGINDCKKNMVDSINIFLNDYDNIKDFLVGYINVYNFNRNTVKVVDDRWMKRDFNDYLNAIKDLKDSTDNKQKDCDTIISYLDNYKEFIKTTYDKDNYKLESNYSKTNLEDILKQIRDEIIKNLIASMNNIVDNEILAGAFKIADKSLCIKTLMDLYNTRALNYKNTEVVEDDDYESKSSYIVDKKYKDVDEGFTYTIHPKTDIKNNKLCIYFTNDIDFNNMPMISTDLVIASTDEKFSTIKRVLIDLKIPISEGLDKAFNASTKTYYLRKLNNGIIKSYF